MKPEDFFVPFSEVSFEAGTFNNSILGTLIWNADTSLPASVFSNMAMPVNANFLLYVNSRSYAPSNVSNVVVGSTASKITLKDGIDTRFYCPKAFIAQTISYTHHYGMTTGGNGKGWETIALPFDVQRIEHQTKGEVTPFASYQRGSNGRPFWLYELGSNGFRRAGAIKANTPYIIAMPNGPDYDEEYLLAGDVTFSATDVTIAETDKLVTVASNGKRFVPAFGVVDSSPSVYALNVTNLLVTNNSGYEPGSRFVSDLRIVYPFEAYITSSSNARSMAIEFDHGTTDVDEIPMADGNEGRVMVYSLGGQLLIDADKSSWHALWHQLPPGVYLVNGKKVLK